MANTKLRVSLFLLRLTIFIVFLMWTVDKLLNPGHSADIFDDFYHLSNLTTSTMYIIGMIELLIIGGFILGLFKTITYGAVLLFQAVAVIASFDEFFSPFVGPNLLFFSSLPMLAGCIALFLLRKNDTLFSL